MENIQSSELGQLNPVVSKQKPHTRMLRPEEIDKLPGREMAEKRTRAGKVFSLSGNLYQSILYPDPVHFQDGKTGRWEEINNTLVQKKDKAGISFLMNKQNGDLTVSLYPASAAQMVVLKNENGSSLSWSLEGAKDIAPEMVASPSFNHRGRDQRRKVLKQIESQAVYQDILPGADLVCKVLGARFKDELVFGTRESAVPVTFVVTAPGLHLANDGKGVIAVVSATGETEFALPAPFLKDAAQEAGISPLAVSLQKAAGQDMWRITYTPDQAWLNTAVFPVILDPVVETRQHSSVIQDNFVTSVDPDTCQNYAATNLRISYGSPTYGTSKSFIKFLTSDLPSIDSSYYVTKAFLSIAFKTRPTAAAPVYLKEVLGDWSSQSITYNNQPATSAMDVDYENAPTNVSISDTLPATNTRLNYDISNLVRKWYTDVNYGVMLESRTNTYFEFFSSDHAYAKPYVVINYVSLAGLEDYLAYESQSIGRAGAGHVSIYNGNLIFEHQDTACNGSLMPVSISHIYNSCYKDSDAFGAGNGWKTTIQQCLHKETISTSSGSTTYYVYTDGDGTRHHFKQTAGVWEDQSGLSMKLEISGSTATIRDKADSVMNFDLPTVEFGNNFANVKMLKSIQDALGNTATFTLSGTGITNARDGAGRDTAITMTNGRIASINAPGYSANGVSYVYNGSGQLTQITHEDGAITTYTYNSLGLLESASNLDGLTVAYEYYTVRAPYRVKKVTVSNGEVLGNCRLYEYKDCLTVITDLTVPDGKKLFYHFNDYGNVVSVNDQLGYAAFAKYAVNSPVNHPEAVSKMQRAVCNTFRVHDFEKFDWALGYTSGNGNCYEYVTDTKYMGAACLKLIAPVSGFMAANCAVYMTLGQPYTFSFYGKKEGSASVNLIAYYMNKDNVSTAIYMQQTPYGIPSEFERIYATFQIPEDAATNRVTIRIQINSGVGAIWIDCAQLEPGTSCNRYNLLANSDFSYRDDLHAYMPSPWVNWQSWQLSDAVYDTYDGEKPDLLSARTMRIYGDVTKVKYIYQSIRLGGSAGDVYVSGGWSKGYSKPRKGESNLYGIRLAFKNSAGTYVDASPIEWSDEWTEWQFACAPVIAPCDYTEVRFYIDYQKNINYAEFDGLFLHKEEFGQTFAYDEKKNVTSVKDLSGQKSNATYDAFDNMLTYRQPGRPAGVQTTLEYGTTDAEKQKHLVQKTTDPMGVVQAFQYDSKGNPTLAKTQNSSGASYIQGTTAYTANQNYVASQTDSRGMTVTSNIDLNRGTLTSVTDPNGQTVGYTYDTLKRVTATTAAAEGKTYKNEYVYAADKLTQVKHNTTSDSTCDVVYNFEYDALSNPTTVKVGDQPLSTNVYSATGDKLLSRVEYGNGGQVSYTRDAFKRVTGIRYDNAAADRYQYAFDANGQTAQVADNHLNRITTFEYDAANRPMRVRQKAGSTNLYTSTLGYDAYNNLNSFNEKVESAGYETIYAYDNGNRPTAVQFGSAANQVGYTYDALGRVSARTLTVGGTNYATSYGFEGGGQGAGSTTSLVNNIVQPNHPFTYTYDDVGNITSVDMHRSHNIVPTYQTFTVLDEQLNQVHGNETLTQPVSVQVADYPEVAAKIFYHYDNLGQLIRVDDPYDKSVVNYGTTWVYTYDRGGNILSKTKYVCTNGALGTPMGTYSYTYDSTWKDKLAAYNGVSIAYDAIGNPLNDGTWAYIWQAGRQLASMAKSGTTATFAYNADGLWVRKTVNGTATDYTLHGKQVVHLKKGGDNLHFFYDAQGRPAVVEWNGVKYGYVQNLQGDIVAIIDGGGNTVVQYTYDAWGKPIDKAGTLATTLGTMNPFRYRGLYYASSRYYSPEKCRFLYADTTDILISIPTTLMDKNLFAYCDNNPVMPKDNSGTF